MPGDEPEFAGEQEIDPALDAAEAFKRLVFMCVPPKTYGQSRIGPAAHRRFIAIVWVVCPEVYEGKSQADMAAMCGMSLRAFKYACQAVNATIAARKTKK